MSNTLYHYFSPYIVFKYSFMWRNEIWKSLCLRTEQSTLIWLFSFIVLDGDVFSLQTFQLIISESFLISFWQSYYQIVRDLMQFSLICDLFFLNVKKMFETLTHGKMTENSIISLCKFRFIVQTYWFFLTHVHVTIKSRLTRLGLRPRWAVLSIIIWT